MKTILKYILLGGSLASFILPINIYLLGQSGYGLVYDSFFLHGSDIVLLCWTAAGFLGWFFQKNANSRLIPVWWNYAVLGFLGMSFASIFWWVQPQESLFWIFRWIWTCTGIYGFCEWICKKSLKQQALWMLVFFMCGESLLGLLQVVFGHSMGLTILEEPQVSIQTLNVAKDHYPGFTLLRGFGTFSHPNIFAGFLWASFIGSFYLNKSLIRSFSQILLCIGMVATGSKLLLWLGFLLLFFGVYRHASKGSQRWLLLFGLLTWLLYCAFYFGETLLEMSFIHERVLSFMRGFSLLLHFPFGVGYGGLDSALIQSNSFLLKPWEFQPIHNSWLHMLVTFGVVGGGALLGIFMACIFSGLRRLYILNKLILLIGLLGFLFQSMVDHYFITLPQGLILLACWMCVALKSRNIMHKKSTS